MPFRRKPGAGHINMKTVSYYQYFFRRRPCSLDNRRSSCTHTKSKWSSFVFSPERTSSLDEIYLTQHKNTLEVREGITITKSRIINFRRGLRQGHVWAPVGFCLGEIPICLLLEESQGFMIGPPGKRETKLTHNLFIDDLKSYQPNHKTYVMVNETLVRISTDIGALYTG